MKHDATKSNQRAGAFSETTMHEIVLPSHTNALGTAFGGTIMSWIDICGAITAQRHVGGNVVTASIDQLNFIAPVRLGDVVKLVSRVTFTGRTSIEVRVNVSVIDTRTNTEQHAVLAFVTFVAVDEANRPIPAVGLDTSDPEDAQNYEAGRIRRERRLAARNEDERRGSTRG